MFSNTIETENLGYLPVTTVVVNGRQFVNRIKEIMACYRTLHLSIHLSMYNIVRDAYK